MSVLHTLEHAHTRPACPSDLSHTHPRNYGERTGRCQRGEAGAVFYPLQVGDYTGADVDSRPALEKTLLVQYFIICSYLTQSPPPPLPEKMKCLLLKSRSGVATGPAELVGRDVG